MRRQHRDLTGQEFGRLTVIDFADEAKAGSNYRWNCICSCGNTCTPKATSLVAGHTKSCGCLKLELSHAPHPYRWKDFDTIFANYTCSKVRGNAKKRGYTFELTREQILNLVKANCFYCNIPPATAVEYSHHSFNYNGIDRKDNSIGYTLENCVPCCWQCNRAKFTMSVDEFLSFINRVNSFQENKNARAFDVGLHRETQNEARKQGVQKYMSFMCR